MQNEVKMPRFGSQTSQQTDEATADSLSAGWQSRTAQEALDEVARELGVRERLYGRWVKTGQHTETDAKDRMQRMIMAAALIDALLKQPEAMKHVSCQMEAVLEDKQPF